MVLTSYYRTRIIFTHGTDVKLFNWNNFYLRRKLIFLLIVLTSDGIIFIYGTDVKLFNRNNSYLRKKVIFQFLVLVSIIATYYF